MVKQTEVKVKHCFPSPSEQTELIDIKYQPFPMDEDPPLPEQIRNKLVKHNMSHSIPVFYPMNNRRCVFCDITNHPSFLCPLSFQERKTRLRSQQICPKCLEKVSLKSHKWCDATDICKICFSKNHHILMCPRNKLTNEGFNLNVKIPIESSSERNKPLRKRK